MFTDKPKLSVKDGYCPHYNSDVAEGIESFCYRAGECEGWIVWACTTCGFIYFTNDYRPEVLGPTTTFTLSDVLQAYNWALKGKDDEPNLRAALIRAVITYIAKYSVDRKDAFVEVRAVLDYIEANINLEDE